METDCIIINNITQPDCFTKRIRILIKNRHLFPPEQIGNPVTYKFIFVMDKQEFSVRYTIGTKDRKSRSGVLSLGKKLYLDVLNIKKGTIVKICKVDHNKYNVVKV